MENHHNGHHHHHHNSSSSQQHNHINQSNHQHQQSDSLHQEAVAARLCHIVKWEDFDGYGFNLHAEKGKIGQYIGKVDENSPSEAAGLRQGDRIIEVNEINITGETHKQVVERIKAFPQETKLLVVDAQADEYFRAHNVVVRGTMPGVKVMKTPERSGMAQVGEDIDKSSTSSSSGRDLTGQEAEEEQQLAVASPAKSNGSATQENGMLEKSKTSINSNESTPSSHADSHDGPTISMTVTPTQENGKTASSAGNSPRSSATENSMPAPKMSPMSSPTPQGSNGKSMNNSNSNSVQPPQQQEMPKLNLSMSAKDFRAKLAARKKYDPKKEPIGFKDKFDIIQKL